MRKIIDFHFWGLTKIFLLVVIPLSLFLSSCHEPTPRERITENLIPAVKKVLPYVGELEVTDTTFLIDTDSWATLYFTITGKDINGNKIYGDWDYTVMKGCFADENGNEIEFISPRFSSFLDSALYSTNYPVNINLEDKESNSKSSNDGYIKKHQDKGVTWFELIKDNKHGIVGDNGAIIEPAFYDSIKYSVSDEDFKLYYRYKTEDDEEKKGMAILDKDLYPIIPIQAFAKEVYRKVLDEEGCLYYYTFCVGGCLTIDSKIYWGIADSYGAMMDCPVFSYILYQKKDYSLDFDYPPFEHFIVGFGTNSNDSTQKLLFEQMPVQYYINRSTNRGEIIKEDYETDYYAFVKRWHISYPSQEYKFSYPSGILPRAYKNIIIYKGKLYDSDMVYSCPLIKEYEKDGEVYYCPSSDNSRNNVEKVQFKYKEMIIYYYDGSREYYRRIDDSVFNKMENILNERTKYYIKKATDLAKKNSFGLGRMTRNEIEPK